jgi:hypothetical protein
MELQNYEKEQAEKLNKAKEEADIKIKKLISDF